jgi:hypothetical protein
MAFWGSIFGPRLPFIFMASLTKSASVYFRRARYQEPGRVIVSVPGVTLPVIVIDAEVYESRDARITECLSKDDSLERVKIDDVRDMATEN